MSKKVFFFSFGMRGVLYGKKVKPIFLKKGFFFNSSFFSTLYGFFFKKKAFFTSKQGTFFLSFDKKSFFHVKWTPKKSFPAKLRQVQPTCGGQSTLFYTCRSVCMSYTSSLRTMQGACPPPPPLYLCLCPCLCYLPCEVFPPT